MNPKHSLMEDLSIEEMDLMLLNVDEADYAVDAATRDRIRLKTMEKIGSQAFRPKSLVTLRRILAALIALTMLSFFVPQVQATVRQLFSFIPGVGAVLPVKDRSLLLGVDVTVNRGEDLVMEKPILFADGNGIQLTIQLKGTDPEDEKLNLLQLKDFTAQLNGADLPGEPTGFVASNSDSRVFGLFFQGAAKAGDLVRIQSQAAGVEVQGSLKILEASAPLSLPHARARDITVMADPVKTRDGWDIYMYAVSDKVIPITFTSDMLFDRPIYFEADSGERYRLRHPDSYGTGFLPPLSLEEVTGKGALIIPELAYKTRDKTSYVMAIPKKNEEIRPDNGFSIAGIAISVDRIYYDATNENRLSLDLSWPTGETSLDNFQVEDMATSARLPGKMTVSVKERFSLTGKRTLRISEPEFTWNEELRIPLELIHPAD